MKKLNRLLLGVISTFLLSAGFSRAADRLDPMSLDAQASKRTAAPTPATTQWCDLLEDHQ